MNARKNGRRGFTLVEVLLVVLILGMLATVAVVSYTKIREGAKLDTTKLVITEIETALEAFNMNLSRYPTDDEGLGALLTKPQFETESEGEKWRGPYFKREPKDAWDREIHYEAVEGDSAETGGKPYKLWSDGPDGQNGTEDDIKNWKEEEGA